jgi:hypothetical protein
VVDTAAAPAAESLAVAPRPLRGDADFLRYWAARTVSVSGSAVSFVVLPVLVYRLTNSPLWTGVVSVAETIPYLLLGLLAGAIADRLNRRWMMVSTDLASAAVVASIPLAALLGAVTAVQALIVAGLAGTLFVFFDAAAFGALPTLVGRDRVAAANSRVWSAATVAEVVVPAATGAALAVLTPPSLMTVDAVSFAISALLVTRITRRLSQTRDAGPSDRPRLGAEIREGVRFLWSHPAMRTVTLIGTAQAVAGGAFAGQLVVYADRALGVHKGDPRLGVLYAGWSGGSLIAALLLPRLSSRFAANRTVTAVLPVSAALAVAVALAPAFAVAVPLIVAWGVAYMLVVVSAVTYRMQVTPEPLLSRVNTLGRMLSYAFGFPVGALLAGSIAAAVGVRAGLLAAACVTAAVACSILLREWLR